MMMLFFSAALHEVCWDLGEENWGASTAVQSVMDCSSFLFELGQRNYGLLRPTQNTQHMQRNIWIRTGSDWEFRPPQNYGIVVFYQSTEDEEHHEQASECSFSVHVSVTHSGHRHHQQIHTLPIRHLLEILEVFPRIAWVFHLKYKLVSPRSLSHELGLLCTF